MEIRTKFDIGDKVYVVYQSCSEYYRVIEIKIDEIIIRRDNHITYSCDEKLSDNGYELGYDEQDLFATKEEAQAECDKRNEGE